MEFLCVLVCNIVLTIILDFLVYDGRFCLLCAVSSNATEYVSIGISFNREGNRLSIRNTDNIALEVGTVTVGAG